MPSDVSVLLQIGQLVAYLVVAAIFIAMLKADIKILRHDMKNLSVRQDALNEGFTQLTQILTKMAVQEMRINGIEDDIRELRHGQGFIVK